MSKYSIGDVLEYTDDGEDDMVQGNTYVVQSTSKDYVTITDEAGDSHDVNDDDFYLVTAPPMTVVCRPSPNITANDVTITVEEDEYVSPDKYPSVGKFKQGDEVTYCDGTQTDTPLIVTRCTASCVWFEGRYTWAFNPDEFCNVNGTDDEGDYY